MRPVRVVRRPPWDLRAGAPGGGGGHGRRLPVAGRAARAVSAARRAAAPRAGRAVVVVRALSAMRAVRPVVVVLALSVARAVRAVEVHALSAVRAVLAVLAVMALAPEAVTPQATGEVRVEAGAATALPAAEVDGDAAAYGMVGASLDWVGERVALVAALYGGLAFDGARGGDFASALLRAEAWSGGGRGGAVGLVGRAYGFTVGDPFLYRNGSILAGPGVRWGGSRGRMEARLEAGTGASVVEVELPRRMDRRPGRIEQHLWSVGGVVEAAADVLDGTVSATAGTWRSAGGPFRSVEMAVTGGGARWAVRGDVGVWDTPLGAEWVGGLALVIPLGARWSVQGAGGRAGPDPLTLVEAGGQGGMMLGWRLAEVGSDGPPRLYETVGSARGTSRVRFRLERPAAGRVEILGGFTGWEPRTMRRDGDVWTLELEVAAGTHHFGFLVDGEWYVPEGHPGNVPDEWGRTNATLVVPPASREGES